MAGGSSPPTKPSPFSAATRRAVSASVNWLPSMESAYQRLLKPYAASEIRPEEIDPICHVNNLTNDQQIVLEQWSNRWKIEFERRTDKVEYPNVTEKTRDVFLQIEEEMGKSGERIAEAVGVSA